jgi:hypothetical protein
MSGVLGLFESGKCQTDWPGGVGFYAANDGTVPTDDPGAQDPPPMDDDTGDAAQTGFCGGIYSCCTKGSGYNVWGAVLGMEFGTTTTDLTSYSGVRFWIKRNGASTASMLKLGFPDVNTDAKGGVCDDSAEETKCANDYKKMIYLPDESWTEFTVAFSELTQDTTWGLQTDAFAQDQVFGMKFQVDGTESNPAVFDFCIDNLELY